MSAAPSAHPKCLYSPSCDLLGVCRPDGVLQVYDAKVGVVKGEVQPSKHLLAACTCLAWRKHGEEEKKSPTKKSRKRKSSISQNGSTNSGDPEGSTKELAVGTGSGSVVVYSVKTAECKESNVHDDVVTDLTWNHDGSTVYSASKDGHIGVWRVRKTASSKFRPVSSGKHPLSSLALLPEEVAGNGVLVGAEAQVMWVDMDTKTVVRSFGGHGGAVAAIEVFSLPSSAKSAFFLSAGSSEKDRMINVWKLEAKGKSKKEEAELKPEALLNASEALDSLTVTASSDGEEEVALVGCVSKTGVFRLFDFDPNGKRKGKAVRPKVTVQVSSGKDKSGKVSMVPIRTGSLSQDGMVHLAHGAHGRLSFETLEAQKLDKTTCLVREADHSQPQKDYGTKFMNPSQSGATVLAPGASMTPRSQKRKVSESGGKMDQLPMLDRLQLLSKSSSSEVATTPPRTDSMLQLLLQGLHNRDQRILESVLNRAEQEVIDKTVRKLPCEGVVPLIQELQCYIKGRGMINLSHSKWLRSVLQHHSAYLMSIPQCSELLGPVFAMLEARTKNYASLMHLKGKLDIITKQISGVKDEEAGGAGEGVDKEALLVYQDDSSDELSDVLDDLLLPASDNEDAWDLDGDEGEKEDSDDEEHEDKSDEDSDDHDDGEEGEDEDSEMDQDEAVMVNGVNGDEDMDSE